MKKLLVVTGAALLSTILFQGCNPLIQSGNKPNVNSLTADTCVCKQYDDYDLQNIFPAIVAQRLALAYRGDNGKKYIGSLDAVTTNEDSRSVWFDLDTLRAYLSQIQHAACEKNCSGLRLGIRIYYAKYPTAPEMLEIPSLAHLPSKYALHHTIFLVPTFDKSGKHVDFDPYVEYQSSCQPYTLKYLMMPHATGPALLPSSKFILTGGGDANNHGGLIPPPPGEGDFPIGDF